MPDGYLDAQASRDADLAAAAQKAGGAAFDCLVKSQLMSGLWPYELVNVVRRAESKKFSASTQAMILHAICVSTGRIRQSVLVPALEDGAPFAPDKKLERLLRVGVRALFKELAQLRAERPKDLAEMSSAQRSRAVRSGMFVTKSSTWGDNDPLTLTWIQELINSGIATESGVDPEEVAVVSTRISASVRSLVERALGREDGPLLRTRHDDGRREPHPFILLRVVHLARAANHELARADEDALAAMFTRFLNAELANSGVRDGGFDPASLMFSLEGLMELQLNSVAEQLIARVMEVMARDREVADHWRPSHPITTTPQGLVLLPQSVEVANSFLRIADAWQQSRRGLLFSSHLGLLTQYTGWIVAAAVNVRVASRSYVGWQSEHTHEPGTIHLWATSQALLFLVHYEAMLRRHMAREGRIDASLDFTPHEHLAIEARLAEWTTKRGREPLIGLPPTSKYLTYEQAHGLFVEPRLANKSTAYYSILLYGPPGTGKTDFAEGLAQVLGYDFIAISPSDFTRSGEAGVEARAQRLFRVLEMQSRCVVLFDEIDRLVLDRESPQYGEQSDTFQFMTPSMLTKLNELRRLKRCIFVIATNYAERIDGAIKRPGRIDARFVLMPPNREQRAGIVANECASLGLRLSARQQTVVAKAFKLQIFKEIQESLAQLQRSIAVGASFSAALNEVIRESKPTISLASYMKRFTFDPAATVADRSEILEGPWLEFSLLAYLYLEVDEDLPPWTEPLLRAIAGDLADPVKARVSAYLHR